MTKDELNEKRKSRPDDERMHVNWMSLFILFSR